jgi:hypothetical protein
MGDSKRIGRGHRITPLFTCTGVVGEPGIPRDCSPLNCPEPTPACNEALSALERVRRLIVEKCAEIATPRENGVVYYAGGEE